MARVAIAVVSWNTRDLLARCLDSIAPEVESGAAEAWVVDNGSSDGSRELVRERYGWAKLVEPDENLGFGRAVNLVAERTESEWVAAANADIELTDGSLETLVDAGDDDPGVGAVAPRLEMLDGDTQHSVHNFPTLSLAIILALGIPNLSHRIGDRLCIEGDWDPERPRYVDWAHGALLLLRREPFEAVGGFDSEQWMYAEDIDIAWRLTEAGHRVRYEPAAVVRHAVSAATSKAFGEAGKEERHIAASYAWMLRRRGLAITWATALANYMGATVRYVLLTPLAPFSERWRRRRRQARRFMHLHRLGLRSRAALRDAA